MQDKTNSTRVRLIKAALELFAAQGVTETTTKQIAELAKVNEVTLFRHFGNKHGLLLAVISESAVFQGLRESLQQQASLTSSVYEALKNYAGDRLAKLEQIPELLLSILGEARKYPIENRQALGQGLTEANGYVAEYLAMVIEKEQLHTDLPAQKLASLLNIMLLGYAVISFTTESHEWRDRDEFLENLVTLFLNNAVLEPTNKVVHSRNYLEKVIDLPAKTVHLILQRAKKSGLRNYALIYVLFAAGLSAAEIVKLERSHQISDTNQHLLQIAQSSIRQVPVNQWIMGKRYGSYTRNPLTQWLKSRKDDYTALFLNDVGTPISELEIQQIWQVLTAGLLMPEGQPVIEQAQQTWRVEMLTKSISLENLSIITGMNSTQLQPYAQRAREKLALEQAIRFDKKS